MVAPITGPITVTYTRAVNGPNSLFGYQVKYKQKPPYSLNLAYERVNAYNTKIVGTGVYSSSAYTTTLTSAAGTIGGEVLHNYVGSIDQAINNCISKFRDKMGDSAMLAVNLAERKQSMDMITNRSMQLFRIAKNLKRFDIPQALKEMGISRRDPRASAVLKKAELRTLSKKFSNLWLEFHFGWAPLVADIYSAVEILSSPISPMPIRAFGKRVPITYYNKTNGSQGSYVIRSKNGVVGACMGASLIVTNPNLYLASRLGLTNPASVIWEAIPFSFVVDWFVNVSDFLENFSSLHGVTLSDSYYTYKITLDTVYDEYYKYFANTGTMFIAQHGMRTKRFLGNPYVTLGLRSPWRLSPSRALTAISLLIQRGFK